MKQILMIIAFVITLAGCVDPYANYRGYNQLDLDRVKLQQWSLSLCGTGADKANYAEKAGISVTECQEWYGRAWDYNIFYAKTFLKPRESTLSAGSKESKYPNATFPEFCNALDDFPEISGYGEENRVKACNSWYKNNKNHVDHMLARVRIKFQGSGFSAAFGGGVSAGLQSAQ